MPFLDWFLTKGIHQTIKLNSASYALCELFGLSSEQGDHPVAAISRLSDDNQHPEGFMVTS